MAARRLSGAGRVARLDAAPQRLVLRGQRVRLGRVRRQIGDADVHMLVQQRQQRRHQVGEDRVAGRIGDRAVEGDIGAHLRRAVASGIGRGHRLVAGGQPRQVGLVGPLGGQLGAARLEHVAEFQQVGLHQRLALQQLGPGVGAARVGLIADEGAGAVAAQHQPALGQLSERLAQRRARHAQPHRPVALGRQALARAVLAGQDRTLQARGELVGQAGGEGVLHRDRRRGKLVRPL